jgi:dihydropyrimidine dehydrogenase (NAD+) subunit PreT
MRAEPIAPSLRKGRGRPDLWALAHDPDPERALTGELKPPLDDREAVMEAFRCLECGGPYAPAPCTVACPAEIDVPGFIGAVARGQVERAAAIILEANPLGGTCARVCPTEVLCEGACVLEAAGQRPVDIGRLQRYAVDQAFLRGLDPVLPERPPNGRRVAVIGAGPAGLACAAELARAGYAVTVYDERPEVGGLVRYAIAPYRQVRDPLPAEMERLVTLGVTFRLGFRIDSPERLAAVADTADAVFLGVGLGEDADVRYEGDTLEGVWKSLAFIEALKTGRRPPVGERVAVVGGGNTAVDVAREAVRLGAREVTVLYRRTAAEMPAFRHEVAEAEAEGVHFAWLTQPVRLLGTRRVTGVLVQYMRLGEPDASGRRRPEPVPGTEFVLPVDTVVLAVGQRPRAEFLQWIPGLRLEHGRIVRDPETGQTTHPRYFVGGDAANGGATVVEAVREGKIAARGIDRVLSGAGRGVS